MNLKRLATINLRMNMGRTVGLCVLVALLAFSMFGGTLLVSSLRNGLSSLEARLGADIIVVPDQAKSKYDLEQIIVDGVPGHFYMDRSYIDQVAAVEGVEKVSPQYFLATAKASCCSVPVQIIGYDPATDFSIGPWIDHSNGADPGFMEVVVGSDVGGAVNTQVLLYGKECTIIGKLDETGTALDTAIFCTSDTIKVLINSSVEKGFSPLSTYDPDAVISTVQVKVADGVDPKTVTDYINLHVRGAHAEQAKAMTSGVADSMAGVSRVIGVMVAGIWILAVIVLVVAFSVLGKHRTKEFAVLRVLGASRKALNGLVLRESALISLVGAAAGTVLALAAVFVLHGALEDALNLPFLLPSAGFVAVVAVLAFVVGAVIGPLASAVSASRLSKVDPGNTLREE